MYISIPRSAALPLTIQSTGCRCSRRPGDLRRCFRCSVLHHPPLGLHSRGLLRGSLQVHPRQERRSRYLELRLRLHCLPYCFQCYCHPLQPPPCCCCHPQVAGLLCSEERHRPHWQHQRLPRLRRSGCPRQHHHHPAYLGVHLSDALNWVAREGLKV